MAITTMRYPIPSIPAVQGLDFRELPPAPLPRMLSLGWADLPAHAWDHPGADSLFWTLYRNQTGGSTLSTRDGELPMVGGATYLIPAGTRFARVNRRATRQLYAYFDVIGLDPAGLPAVIAVPGATRAHWLASLAAAPQPTGPADSARLAALILAALVPYAAVAEHVEPQRRALAPALGAMQADPARSWSLDELAARCGWGADTFGRRFHRALGLSPVQWLRRHRARLAAHHLATGADSLEAIARTVGFGTRPYLSRVFRAIMGVGPSEYRQVHGRDRRPLGPRR